MSFYTVTTTSNITRSNFNNKRWVLKSIMFWVFSGIVLATSSDSEMTQEVAGPSDVEMTQEVEGPSDVEMTPEEKEAEKEEKREPIKFPDNHTTLVQFSDDQEGTYNTNNLQQWFNFFKAEIRKRKEMDIEGPIDIKALNLSHREFTDIYLFLSRDKLSFEVEELVPSHFRIMDVLKLGNKACETMTDGILTNSDDVLKTIVKVLLKAVDTETFPTCKSFIKFVPRFYKFVDIAGGGRYTVWAIRDDSETNKRVDESCYPEVGLNKEEYDTMEEIKIIWLGLASAKCQEDIDAVRVEAMKREAERRKGQGR